MEGSGAHAQVQPDVQKPFDLFNGGREWRVEGSRFPISTTMTGVVLEMDPGGFTVEAQ